MITQDANTICRRLSERDNKEYNVDNIQHLLGFEKNQAYAVAKDLGIEIVEMTSSEIDKVKPLLNEFPMRFE